MICEINKIYIVGAPQAADGMTPGDDDFIESTANGTYVKTKRIDVGEIRSYTKVFNNKNLLLQATIYVTDLPEGEAKRRVNDRIKAIKNYKEPSNA